MLRGWALGLISTISSGGAFNALVNGVSLTGSEKGRANLLAETGFGSINRSIKTVKQLNELVSKWNTTLAGKVDKFGAKIPQLGLLPDDGTIRFGDSSISQDIRITKSFKIGERAKVQGITEIFNLFNISNQIGFGTNTAMPQVGLRKDGKACLAATCTSDEIKQSEFFQPTNRANSIFGFGGSRAVQFAVRFEF